jgi:hypothetical protein
MKTKQKSLRQLARELGVSQSYLSQIKSGKRPPSEKVISKLNGKMISKIMLNDKQIGFDTTPLNRYNQSSLPSCVAVARGTLDPLAQVRILARQPPLKRTVVFRYSKIFVCPISHHTDNDKNMSML